MLFTSRGLDEYRAMFALTSTDLSERRVLDACAGAADLVAQVHRAGGSAIAVDPAYARGLEELQIEVTASLSGGQQLIDDHQDQFVWHWYGTPGNRDRLRAQAAQGFLADFAAHPERYVAAALPDLPFEDDSFDLALCSHLLFTWARRFDAAWHVAALLELVRVARDVRVFPLVHAGDGAPVEFLDSVVESLRAHGLQADVLDVEYEFQRGAHKMLRLRRLG